MSDTGNNAQVRERGAGVVDGQGQPQGQQPPGGGQGQLEPPGGQPPGDGQGPLEQPPQGQVLPDQALVG